MNDGWGRSVPGARAQGDAAPAATTDERHLRALLEANRTVVGDLDLPTVLRHIAQAAVELVGAEYGALGVIAAEGVGLEEFIHVGMNDADVTAIGHLPEGKGLLGLLIEQPHPIRLDDLSTHERSVGFPESHPPMKAFLGVPIRVRDEVFGNLYLTRQEGGFTPQDEETVQALAATAGVAIENARLFANSEHRQEWLAASADVGRRLLTGDAGALRLIAQEVRRLADADLITLVVPDGLRLRVAVAEGRGAGELEGNHYDREETLSDLVLETGTPCRLHDATDTAEVDGRTIYLAGQVQVGPVMVLPLLGREQVRGSLVVTRDRGRRAFTELDMEMATTFANHASVALELVEARRDQQRVLLLEDRARIARDLHDHVIQQIFAAGLVVQATATRLEGVTDVSVLNDVVGHLDDAIRQIRVSIFQLQPPTGSGPALRGDRGGLRGAAGPRLRPDHRPGRPPRLGVRGGPVARRHRRRPRGAHQRRQARGRPLGPPDPPCDQLAADRHHQRRRPRDGSGVADQRARQHASPCRGPRGVDDPRRGPRPRRYDDRLDRPGRLTGRRARASRAAGP